MTVDLWFPIDDWPVASTHTLGPGQWPQWPQWYSSESGLRFLIDRDTHDERCAVEHLYFDEVCMMMRGHDTPHLPFGNVYENVLGKLIVREIQRPITGGQWKFTWEEVGPGCARTHMTRVERGEQKS